VLTFDIMFKDVESYDRVLKSRLLTPEIIGRLYGVPEAEVRSFEIKEILDDQVLYPPESILGRCPRQ